MRASRSPLRAEKHFSAGVIFLVIPVDIDVNDLTRLGRYFPWPKPSRCPSCSQNLWWHGFVLAYFAVLAEPVFIRRLYCPHCHGVHRLRPSGYWPRFRSSIEEIRQAVEHRGKTKRWRPDLPRPRQRQWWKRLARMCLAALGFSFAGNLPEAFESLAELGIIPVTSAAESENRHVGHPPYRIVSLPGFSR